MNKRVTQNQAIVNTVVFLGILLSVFSLQCSQPSEKKKYSNDPQIINDVKIDSIINLLNLEEKVNMLCGNNLNTSPGIKRLGIEDITYSDGPSGVREELANNWMSLNLKTDSATFFPTGTALAATWNPELAYEFGEAIGEEAKQRGKDILLGPNVNFIRTPVNGRNYEALSEDPVLNTQIAVQYIKGVQSKDVSACLKHYALNNQENLRHKVDVSVDERALREIYLPPFKAGVKEAGVYAVMAAYNSFRGSFCAENEYLLNTILKKEWGFKGMVMSDWEGTHSAVKSALNGLDVEMGSKEFFTKDLVDSVKAGLIPEEIINDKVKRILRLYFFTHQNSYQNNNEQLSTPEHNQTAYKIACQSVVLLKNSKSLLPLNKKRIRSLAVIGDNAIQTFASGGFGAGVKTRYEITPLQGLKNRLGNSVEINFSQGYKQSYILKDGDTWKSPLNNPDNKLIADAVKAAKKSDATILFIGTNREIDTENKDREDLLLPFGQEELIKKVCAANPNTVVVVISGSPVDLNLTSQSASSIIWSGFNGSETGNAIADVIIGNINPSGKLPFTIPLKLSDSPAHSTASYTSQTKEIYNEGILVGYRWYDTNNIDPAFCFGHGLSYSEFSLQNLKTDQNTYTENDSINVSVEISNVAGLDGFETIQLYVNDLSPEVLKPEKELKAFTKVFIPSGEREIVNLKIPVKKLAWYNPTIKDWIVSKSDYKLLVGTSSRNIQLTTQVKIF